MLLFFYISDFQIEHFWKWTDFNSYVQFIAAFSGIMGLVTYIFINNWVYIETIGFLAVFAEAMLGAPQFYRNFTNKSTQGMRYVSRNAFLLSNLASSAPRIK